MKQQAGGGRTRKTGHLRRFVAVAASLVLVVGGAWMVGRQPRKGADTAFTPYGETYAGTGLNADALRSRTVTMESAPAPSAVDESPAMADYEAQAPAAQEKAQTKIIRRVSLSISSASFDADLEKLNQLLKEKGGYVEYSDISADAGTRRYANFTLRIPKDNLDAYLAGAQGIGRTLNFSESQEDVSEQYMDTDTRLATQVAKMERLQLLLIKALLVEDILRIESEIADTQYQIDRLTGSLRGLDSKVDYATVSLNLSEQRAPQENPTYTLGERILNAMGDAWRAVQEFLEEALIGLIVLAPYIIVLAIIVFIITRIVKRRKNK